MGHSRHIDDMSGRASINVNDRDGTRSRCCVAYAMGRLPHCQATLTKAFPDPNDAIKVTDD